MSNLPEVKPVTPATTPVAVPATTPKVEHVAKPAVPLAVEPKKV